MKNPCRLVSLFFALGSFALHAQEPHTYSMRQSLSVFAEYSNTSSHVILGVTQNRRLTALGLAYSRRLLHTQYADWYYAPELLPFALIQDPVANLTVNSSAGTFSESTPSVSACRPAVIVVQPNPGSGFSGYTVTRTCSTRSTYAGGLSPLGQRINFIPHSRIQPFVIGNAGFLVAPRDIPVNDSSRFNFTFEFGAGIEFFHDHHHSWSAEYRIHHLSNDYTGNNNPGIDNQIVKVTYSFGR
ncbi:acyloxyacyl hydrolase [Edaphobacter flagellatus]|uniref:acyloxyacyl hydrolase n=1 Tax=Edaphobacter flagellatus TaxID=1933044 RepID=UPI0021B16C0C|nr:acyloxyacyl hydrolase [Edaphobacter flagellatus]